MSFLSTNFETYLTRIRKFGFECDSFINISSHQEKYFGRHFQAVNMSLFKYFTQLKGNAKISCREANSIDLSLLNVDNWRVSNEEAILVLEELVKVERKHGQAMS